MYKFFGKLNSKFAPAGYGLGANGFELISDLDTDDLLTGWYRLHTNTLNVPNGVRYANVQVINWQNEVIQIVYEIFGITLIRRNIQGALGEWEYVNPPMELGVEYRTTERWQGKPVYVKAINFGYLPNNERSATSHGITSKHTNLRYTITSVGTNRLLTGNSYIPDIFADDTEISILTTADLSAIDVVFTLWYTKY